MSGRQSVARLGRLGALLGVLLLAAACSAVPDMMVPSSRYTFQHDGIERAYRVYQPPNVVDPAPLVVVLHGLKANTINAEQGMGFDERAKIARYRVAYPEGIDWSWNAGGCCGAAVERSVDDVGFITEMVKRIKGVDPARVYVAGFSNGGMLAFRLACTTDLFAAIGVAEATQFEPCENPRPTSVMQVQGLADLTLRYQGTPKGGPLTLDGPPVPQVNEFWRRINDCLPPTTDKKDGRMTAVAQCRDGRSVELMTIEGLQHDWPTGIQDEMWNFFKDHPKPATP